MADEFPRELAEYDPGDPGPSRSARRLRTMRILVAIALLGLVLPGVLVTVGTQISTADSACRVVVAATAPDSIGARARFEVMGAAGPGWYCYAVRFGGSEVLLRALGIIPGLGSRTDLSPGQPA
jgi:hypothetical protein